MSADLTWKEHVFSREGVGGGLLPRLPALRLSSAVASRLLGSGRCPKASEHMQDWDARCLRGQVPWNWWDLGRRTCECNGTRSGLPWGGSGNHSRRGIGALFGGDRLREAHTSGRGSKTGLSVGGWRRGVSETMSGTRLCERASFGQRCWGSHSDRT